MTKPKIRLNGFDGEWVMTPFSKFGELRRGLSYSPSNLRPSGIRVLRSSNIQDDSFKLSVDDVFVTKDCVSIELVKDGDILITAANGSPRLVGKHCLISNPQNEPMVHGGFMLLAKSNESEFLNSSMSSSWFRDFQRIGVSGGNGAIGNLNKNELEAFRFFVPVEKKEREFLAEYFKSLESIIQTAKKKIDALKQIKAASLITLFPQEGESAPRVRFEGFYGDWENKRLSDCLDVSNETNIGNVYGPSDVLSVSDDWGVMNQIKLLGRSYAGKSVSNYGILKKGDLVYTKSPLKSKPFGIFKQNTYQTGIVSALYAIYSAKEGFCPDFIHYYFDPAWRLNAYMRPLVNKGAKNTMNISNETALTGKIMIPKDIEEQQLIAAFFCNLDKQIALQEKILVKIKHVKSACLDKMFV